MKKLLKYSIVLLFLGLLILSAFLINYHFDRYKSEQKLIRQTELENHLENAKIKFAEGLNKFALLVSGLKYTFDHSDGRPQAINVRDYLKSQKQFLNDPNSIIINYFDSDHNFIFTISSEELQVNEFVGSNLSQIRDTSVVKRMEWLMQSEGIIGFPPINLYEGFVGLPIDFRHQINNTAIGYVTPMINIKELILPIDVLDPDNKFTFKFYYDNTEFDREYVNNGTEKHHEREDSLNLDRSKEDYLFSELEAYGVTYNIGIGRTNIEKTSFILPFIKASLAMLALYLFSIIGLIFLSVRLMDTSSLLRDRNQLLRSLIHAFSHDLKSPIVNIKSYSDLIGQSKELNKNSKLPSPIEVIRQSANYMLDLIRNLEVYSLETESNYISDYIHSSELRDELSLFAQSQNVELHMNSFPDFKANKVGIMRVFRNLISNSVYNSDSVSTIIQIKGKKVGSVMEFTISDNSKGLPADWLTKIFEPFARLGKSNNQGTGLGLAICKDIINKHRGQIKASNLEKGGLEIKFTLSQK